MLNKLLSHGDFKEIECIQLASILWNISIKSGDGITRLHVNKFIMYI